MSGTNLDPTELRRTARALMAHADQLDRARDRLPRPGSPVAPALRLARQAVPREERWFGETLTEQIAAQRQCPLCSAPPFRPCRSTRSGTIVSRGSWHKGRTGGAL